MARSRMFERAAAQPVGFVVSAAPLETIERGGCRMINLPVYLASRRNIELFADRPLKKKGGFAREQRKTG